MKLAMAAAPAILSLAFAAPSHAQSFNCNYAKTPDEVLICKSAKLSQLDEQLAATYFHLRNILFTPYAKRLEAEQSAWLRGRLQCGYAMPCVESMYRERLAVLRDRLDEALIPGE
jgi:uncharacterized protein